MFDVEHRFTEPRPERGHDVPDTGRPELGDVEAAFDDDDVPVLLCFDSATHFGRGGAGSPGGWATSPSSAGVSSCSGAVASVSSSAGSMGDEVERSQPRR